MNVESRTPENNGRIQVQPVKGKESEGTEFTIRLGKLQDQLTLSICNLQERLGPVMREAEIDLAISGSENQSRTKYFMEVDSFLNSIESDIDRLNSILDRLEI